MNNNNGSIIQALQWATRVLRESSIATPRLDAEVLLTYCTNRQREDLYSNYTLLLEENEWNSYVKCIERRVKREPVAYITGRKEFRGRTFTITPDVLIPRPETETLVEVLLEKCTLLKRDKDDLKVLELGTGSGIIAVSLAQEINGTAILATDITFEKIGLARENARMHGCDGAINFIVGYFTQALQIRKREQYFDCIVFNPPYLSAADWRNVQPEIRNYEPPDSLCGGYDGLDCYRNLLKDAASLLQDGGFLLLEMGAGQSVPLTALIQNTNSYSDITVVQDLSGIDRVISARKKTHF